MELALRGTASRGYNYKFRKSRQVLFISVKKINQVLEGHGMGW